MPSCEPSVYLIRMELATATMARRFMIGFSQVIRLHPIAFVLCVVDIVNRTDLSGLWKVLWIIISFFWGIGPILYILLGRGKFW